jgi:hypothetical protein
MSKEELKIEEGDTVKIRLMSEGVIERVWAKVLKVFVDDQEILVELDNHPVSPDFKYKDKLTIPVSYVLDKWIKIQ